MSWFSSLVRSLANMVPRGQEQPRVSGPPASSNGASSFHLAWELPQASGRQGLVEVSAVLEVVAPPQVRALYFWALQVDFVENGETWGGGHGGLQWNRRYPDGTAVNWGGYAASSRGGAVLAGTESLLPGFADDPHTLAYSWRPGRPYRLRVFRSPDTAGAWRAVVEDPLSGISTVIRDLLPPADLSPSAAYLTRPLVWSEVFADCDAPSVSVRWSDLTAVDETGARVRPDAVRVNYQSHHAGGCANTTVRVDETGGFVQVTNTPRTVEQGALLKLPAAQAS